mmetsp:Transcript_67993/g.197042  ORF Transcript_67993/g.197042 Transcript_67993/m.197042 type:complete len:216 (-) Transcript_67993:140-787(-)
MRDIAGPKHKAGQQQFEAPRGGPFGGSPSCDNHEQRWRTIPNGVGDTNGVVHRLEPPLLVVVGAALGNPVALRHRAKGRGFGVGFRKAIDEGHSRDPQCRHGPPRCEAAQCVCDQRAGAQDRRLRLGASCMRQAQLWGRRRRNAGLCCARGGCPSECACRCLLSGARHLGVVVPSLLHRHGARPGLGGVACTARVAGAHQAKPPGACGTFAPHGA